MVQERDLGGSDERFGAEIGKIRSEGVKIKFESRRKTLKFDRKQK